MEWNAYANEYVMTRLRDPCFYRCDYVDESIDSAMSARGETEESIQPYGHVSRLIIYQFSLLSH